MAPLKKQVVVSREGEPIWRSRGYLPHYEEAEQVQMITYRLHDSLPKIALQKLSEEIEKVSLAKREVERRRSVEEYLDKGVGSCFLLN